MKIISYKALFKKRYCFSCGKSIYFDQFLYANQNHSYKDLKKIWLSKHIRLYCCTCYLFRSIKIKGKRLSIRIPREEKREENGRFKCQNQMCKAVQFHIMASEMLEDFRQVRKKKLVKHIKYFIVAVLVMVGGFIPSLILFMNIYWF